jgi:hypothetical protein
MLAEHTQLTHGRKGTVGIISMEEMQSLDFSSHLIVVTLSFVRKP